jgi:hypothetical protein
MRNIAFVASEQLAHNMETDSFPVRWEIRCPDADWEGSAGFLRLVKIHATVHGRHSTDYAPKTIHREQAKVQVTPKPSQNPHHKNKEIHRRSSKTTWNTAEPTRFSAYPIPSPASEGNHPTMANKVTRCQITPTCETPIPKPTKTSSTRPA